MKKILTILLQIVIVLIGIAVLAFIIWEPLIEGRNTHATLYQVYFNDSFLAYAYMASILFFVSLYQIFQLLGYVRHNTIVSQESAKALRTIRYCMIALATLLIAAVAYLSIVRPGDDIAGGVAISLFLTLISIAFATIAAMFERSLSN
jgi:hypothetical protein